MRKVLFLAFALALASIPGLSQFEGPSSPGLDAVCSADCGMYGTYTCNYTTSCSAVDRWCPKRGSVACNGVTTLCPVCTTADYCWQCQQTGDCVSCCVCAGDTVLLCRSLC